MFSLIKTPFSLDHLKIINRDDVIQFVDNLKNSTTHKKRVIAINTGGTISMESSSEGTLTPSLNFSEMLAQIPTSISDKYQILGLNIFNIDSSQMNYQHSRELTICLNYIYKNLQDSFIGFIIIHGTDTMAYTGANISLMTGKGLPFNVVLTGAQKPLISTLSDAAHNLQMSILTLEALYIKNMAEIVICMGNRCVLANGAVKINEKHINAFDSPLHEYICRFDYLEYPIELASFLNPKNTKKAYTPEIWQNNYSSTLVIHSFVGLNPERIANYIADDSIKAVILYTYGASTADKHIITAISNQCNKKNIPAFSVNPLNGNIKESLYESSKFLLKNNIHPIKISLPTALAKLEIAFCKFDTNCDKIIEFMYLNYVGETPDINRIRNK